MTAAYAAYLSAWKSSGGTLFMHFNDVGSADQYGAWGALESLMQPTTPLSDAPPKWRAIQEFIAGTPCWWTQCGHPAGNGAGQGTEAPR